MFNRAAILLERSVAWHHHQLGWYRTKGGLQALQISSGRLVMGKEQDAKKETKKKPTKTKAEKKVAKAEKKARNK
jgi:hypothetical protein